MAFISLQKINKHYRSAKTLHVLQDVTLNVNQGDYIAIMGASGSGKSTLLNILGLLDWADSGDYFFGDKLINNITREEAALYRNKKIGLVFQSFNLIPYKNAIENIALPLLYQNVPLKERLNIARDCLQQFGLVDWADHLPSELSGGQKQRVAIARAVITNPQLILADEPTGALDSKTAIEVMQLFEKLHQKGITIVLVTHDENIASWADSVIHIKDGRII